MTNKISIPKPCHEDWNNMSPEQQGRHCMACNKTVIDFTNWDEHQIRSYLESHSGERVCGRFNITQLAAAEQENVLPLILKSNISLLKKIAAIVLLCFGVMATEESFAQKVKGKVKCETTLSTKAPVLMGDTVIITHDSLNQKPLTVDTAKQEPQIMGMIKPYQPPPQKKMPKKLLPKSNKIIMPKFAGITFYVLL